MADADAARFLYAAAFRGTATIRGHHGPFQPTWLPCSWHGFADSGPDLLRLPQAVPQFSPELRARLRNDKYGEQDAHGCELHTLTGMAVFINRYRLPRSQSAPISPLSRHWALITSARSLHLADISAKPPSCKPYCVGASARAGNYRGRSRVGSVRVCTKWMGCQESTSGRSGKWTGQASSRILRR